MDLPGTHERHVVVFSPCFFLGKTWVYLEDHPGTVVRIVGMGPPFIAAMEWKAIWSCKPILRGLQRSPWSLTTYPSVLEMMLQADGIFRSFYTPCFSLGAMGYLDWAHHFDLNHLSKWKKGPWWLFRLFFEDENLPSDVGTISYNHYFWYRCLTNQDDSMESLLSPGFFSWLIGLRRTPPLKLLLGLLPASHVAVAPEYVGATGKNFFTLVNLTRLGPRMLWTDPFSVGKFIFLFKGFMLFQRRCSLTYLSGFFEVFFPGWQKGIWNFQLRDASNLVSPFPFRGHFPRSGI